MPKAPSRTPGKKRTGGGKAYRLTCGNCRTRKVKCDGDQPQCRICQAYGDDCHYDKPPPMSQVVAMAEKITQLERRLAEFEQGKFEGIASSSTASKQDQPPVSAEPSALPPRPLIDISTAAEQHNSPSYQSTSAVQEPISSSLATNFGDYSAPATSISSMTAQQLQTWEDAAYQACAGIVHLPLDLVKHLFKTHWSWVHPTFLFVSRPSFLRDAASGGPQFSPLLLLVICFHSTRFTNHNLKDELLARVRLMLGQQLHAEPSVPTVQALLQLSAREIGKGALARGWLYSGMAFRMAVDMGIFSKSNSLDPEKCGVREQLAWSCYMWDKTISLYLGRAPVILDPPAFDPPSLDQTAEEAMWSPHFESCDRKHAFRSSPAHTMTAFTNMCKLTTIVNDVLLTMYAKKVPDQPLPFVQEIAQRLEAWRMATNSCLLADARSQACPPPHILTQNLLYYATIILLHRPLDKNSACRSICRDAAQAVEHLLLLYETALGFSHITYMMSYCAYIAATTALLDMHDGISGAQDKVNTFLRALHGARTSCPAIQRSIDIIVKSYNVGQSSSANTNGEMAPQPSTEDPTVLAQIDPLPAFPYDDSFQYGYIQGDAGWVLPLGGLDPFASDWARIPMDSFNDYPMFAPSTGNLPLAG